MTASTLTLGPFDFEAVMRAEQRVTDRLNRAATVFEERGIQYAVIGAHAVAAWIRWSGYGEGRGTPNVDLMIRRDDLAAATSALLDIGFSKFGTSSQSFVDNPEKQVRRIWDGLTLRFANEKVRADNAYPHPDVDQVTRLEDKWVLTLEPLVFTKLVAWRSIDKVHFEDMAEVRLVDRSWAARFPDDLAQRLTQFFDETEFVDWVAMQEDCDRQAREEQMQKNPSP